MIDADTLLLDLVDGFALLLNSEGIGRWPAPAGGFTPADTGIGPMGFPLGCDRAIALTPYPLTDDPTQALSEVGMQFMFRSAGKDVRDVWTLEGQVKALMLGNYPMTLPNGVRIGTVGNRISTSMGQEEGGAQRWRWASSYPLGAIYSPTPHRY
jgi:hypothetical protein